MRLLNERANLAAQIGAEKRGAGTQKYVPERESEILRAAVESNTGPLSREALQTIYMEILSACRALEGSTRVAFLGPPGTFSHLAVIKHFGSAVEQVAAPSFRDVLLEAEKGGAEYAILPVENSTDGPIGSSLDLMAEGTLLICAEAHVDVHHCLLSNGGIEDIKRVYSSQQPFRQCEGWLRRHMPHATWFEESSSASGCERASKDPESAAVAPSICSKLYGLRILAENIEDMPGNRTRFAILGKHETSPTGRDKTSMLFSTRHEPGALHRALGCFEREGLNLTMIQSRPDKRKPWQYLFFVDFTGHLRDELVQKVLEEIEKESTYLKVLGSYSEAR